jgi:hypothetical protein
MDYTPIITLPTATTTIASLSDWGQPFFAAFILLVVALAGITIGAMIVSFLVGKLTGGAARLFGRRGRGRRRRR